MESIYNLIKISVTHFSLFQLEAKTKEFLSNANFFTANFVTAVFQNYYYNFADVILWAICFVSASIS